ncbi:SfnB family sulfur acquisition oxidoreductase, partial [Acinetobacter baumannii]
DFVRTRTRPWIDAGVEKAAQDPLLIHAIGDIQVRLSAAVAVLGLAADAVEAQNAAPSEQRSAEASLRVAEAKILSTE